MSRRTQVGLFMCFMFLVGCSSGSNPAMTVGDSSDQSGGEDTPVTPDDTVGTDLPDTILSDLAEVADGVEVMDATDQDSSDLIPDLPSEADACTPDCIDKECGPDGCGGDCGTCPDSHVCTIDATCLCVPNCADKDCGNDGCGDSCGDCDEDEFCDQGACITPWTYPDTDQTSCYDDQEQIQCPSVGQPFYGQDGSYQIDPMQFEDNGDGTVDDINTGLTWAKCSAGLSGETCTGTGFNGTQIEAMQYCLDNTDGLPGSGWRLPSRLELFSIINADQDLCVSPPFSALNAQYWTSIGNYRVSFGTCSSGPADVSTDQRARCVRGTPLTSSAFLELGGNIVRDMAVGLMWQQAGDGNPRNWLSALTYCEGLDLGGYDDWRLPNAKELLALVDPENEFPSAVDEDYFPPLGGGGLWSSTTWLSVEHHHEAIHLYPAGGLGGFGNTKAMEKFVRCVRSSPGLFGSVEFDGSSWLHLSDEGITGERTFSLWFKANDLSGKQNLLIKKESPGAGSVRPITIMLDGDDLVAGATTSSGAAEIGSWQVSAGVWHHVAVHVSPDYGEMYVNGMKIAETEMPGSNMDNAQDYTVGATPQSSNYNYYYSGLIYNVKVEPGFVYDSDFDACEIDGVDSASFLAMGSGSLPCD